LAKNVPLSEAEKNALTRLEENPRKVKRGAMIQRNCSSCAKGA
jgi:hypothetical protein